MMLSPKVTTGIPGLDEIVQNLRLGDNVVMQVDSIEDYLHFVNPYIKQAIKDKKNLVYIRFAKHKPLIKDTKNVKVYELDARSGFEKFSKDIHEILTKEGIGAYYVFDCLSDLISAWATDLMIGNFFMVTCPYLFKLDTIAYFAILRNHHSFKTIARIRETTQLLLDIYNFEDSFYVHPLKVWARYSNTMFLPHEEKGDKLIPIINTVDATKLFSLMSKRGAEAPKRYLDYWDRLFLDAEKVEGRPKDEQKSMFEKICSVMIGKDGRMMELVKENFSLKDLLDIKGRMIGTGFIGGKALGMLLARKILSRDKSFDWQSFLEPHDSFFVGSDVFYTYIVENGWWELWLEQKTPEGFFKVAGDLKQKMLSGIFPHSIKEQFMQMLEYFGQSPIIVRSSSLLEDSFGNAFAGKYESLFCVNQGSPEIRYKNFENIVRRVFASTMNEDALSYRMQKELTQQDEQMALLIQRVSGSHHDNFFFPYIGGVGISYNTYVWKKEIDPKAGMLRMVFGLGTRAVNRVEGDYPCLSALDHPLLRPHAGMGDARRFSQHEVDLLNIKSNELETISLFDLLKKISDIDMEPVGKRDEEAESGMRGAVSGSEVWVLTFENLLSKTEFPKNMRKMMETLEKTYAYPVDTEFTLNFTKEKKMQVNLLQCRPLQAKGLGKSVKIPEKIKKEELFISSQADFMGGSITHPIKRVIYVPPEKYVHLNQQEKYRIARLAGELNKQVKSQEKLPTMLIGPGRWGTTDPSAGIPVRFSEINNISALVELSYPLGGMMPELSFGSHFFLDLVEGQIFYIALFPEKENVFFDIDWLNSQPNVFDKLLPDSAKYKEIIKVFDFDKNELKLLSDIVSQKVVCLK